MKKGLVALVAGVREYAEGQPLELWWGENDRLVIDVSAAEGYEIASIDLLDLIEWAKNNKGRIKKIIKDK